MQNKLIVILGPTASGKTALSIKLAKKFNGEIVSADSRQVYKGMDIGSGKVTKKEMVGIPHYLLDVVSPKTRFTVAQYQKLALKKIKNIQKRGKIPILVGGTGFYIQSVIDGIVIPQVKPDWKLREKLSSQPLPELVKRLAVLDPVRAGNIDPNNPRRVIRALEIVLKTGNPVPQIDQLQIDRLPMSISFEVLQIAVKKSPTELKNLIHKRLMKRLVRRCRASTNRSPASTASTEKIAESPLINEVEKLHKSGVSWKRLEEFGLEYRYVAQYLQNKISEQEMINKIQIESEHYAKRQMTWFKRDKNIKWIKNYKATEKLTKKYIH